MDASLSKMALLQALMSAPGYGLQLIERIQGRTGGRLKLFQGSVYPALRALESDGLVESYDAETAAGRGGRPRRYYRITAEGRRVARDDQRAASKLFGLALAPGGAQ